jgi:hypothetical protein
LKHVDGNSELVPPTPLPAPLLSLTNDQVVGQLLDHWIARAQQLRNTSDHTTTVAYLPAHMRVTLPRIGGNAAVCYFDVHHDHLAGFIWQCGALIDYYTNGTATAQYPLTMQTTAVPDFASEGQLLGRWLRQITTIWDVHIHNVDMTHTVPLHFVVYEQQAWDGLLEALGRHYDTDPVIQAWHDLSTTPRPHDAPLVTMVSNEANASNRLATTVPSMMALASMNGFPWKDNQHNYRAFVPRISFRCEWTSRPRGCVLHPTSPLQ